MQIRLATLADVPAIMQLITEALPEMIAVGNFQWDNVYPNPEVFEKDISLKQLWVAVATGRQGDDDIAGVTAITTDQSPEYATIGWDITETAIVVHRLAVSIHHRGKGIAALLMQQAEQVALQKNIKILRVDTNTANEATQKLFPKLGYAYAGEIDLAFRPGMRFYCYEKKLN